MTRAVAAFLAVAYGISWSAFFARNALSLPAPLDETLRLLVKFGPSLAGVVLVAATGGWKNVRSLFARLLRWRVRAKWYAVVFLAPAAIMIVPITVRVLLGSRPVETINFAIPASFVTLVTLLLIRFFAGGGLGEELGWRGFMLPHLQRQVGPVNASLMIGLFHGFWHLPAYGLGGTLFLTLFTTAGAIILTWMYNRTAGNLLLPALMHAAVNAYVAFVDVLLPDLDGDVGWLLLFFVVLWLVAIRLLRQLNSEETR